MKTIGVLGGMSWESTQSYYRLLNEGVRQRLGGHHSARIALVSVDFAEIEALQRSGQWDEAGQQLAKAAGQVEAAGAECLLLATNTMHKVAPAIDSALGIPLLHIADATGERLAADGIDQVGLLGTRFTMEQPFYRERLTERYGIHCLIPEEDEREAVHRIIFEELVQGVVSDDSREHYRDIVANLHARGARAIILGCTEIALLLSPQDSALPLYDTTALHVEMGLAFALDAR
ncbi:aspartate/glutamate racemase family protein [Salinicola endophyticus]|uniref:Aspartate/glutamate racemase family protein n=1 Tax=Salinicola endophyticus TaxID=1949083 RepID=A0ABY8FIE1_9GAMM|nr:aspartate/glutamate racemase family protein [Salinicola endophyticus]WFF41393.1 aspartate/glutamate racemase family protein [Salinicola endophyticus]